MLNIPPLMRYLILLGSLKNQRDKLKQYRGKVLTGASAIQCNPRFMVLLHLGSKRP